MNLNSMICAHCGKTRGQHRVFSYNCPIEGAGFDERKRFKLKVSRLSDDCHAVKALVGRPLVDVEREIARKLIKQFEQQLGLFDFSKNLTHADILDGINLIRAGYGI